MAKFSERYGYSKPSEVIIRESIPIQIQNSILNWLDTIESADSGNYQLLQMCFWMYHLNQDVKEFDRELDSIGGDFFRASIKDTGLHWYDKLDIIEFILEEINLLDDYFEKDDLSKWMDQLNFELERHNYAYRIIDTQVVEITSETEIEAIETALNDSPESVGNHISNALHHLSSGNQNPDFRASIKESISAVEAQCRIMTQTNTLGDALKALKSKGIEIHPTLKKAMEMLYGYSNDANSGIRHALMDSEGSYAPSSAEAIYMLVTSSAFINYLKKLQG